MPRWINNAAEACRVLGVSRKTYYEWVRKAEQYAVSVAAGLLDHRKKALRKHGRKLEGSLTDNGPEMSLVAGRRSLALPEPSLSHPGVQGCLC